VVKSLLAANADVNCVCIVSHAVTVILVITCILCAFAEAVYSTLCGFS